MLMTKTKKALRLMSRIARVRVVRLVGNYPERWRKVELVVRELLLIRAELALKKQRLKQVKVEDLRKVNLLKGKKCFYDLEKCV